LLYADAGFQSREDAHPLAAPILETRKLAHCCGLSTGNSRSNNWSMRLKIAVLAPTPSANEMTAITITDGFFRIERKACLKFMAAFQACAAYRNWDPPERLL
jgi:hypothetical protein